jgi:hypothetical protein
MVDTSFRIGMAQILVGVNRSGIGEKIHPHDRCRSRRLSHRARRESRKIARLGPIDVPSTEA